MAYYIGQFFGILATLFCFIVPFFKHKWQMLVAANISNLFLILNLLFLGQVSSAMFINVVSTIQTFLSLWHVVKEKQVTIPEQVLFLILYFACGLLGFRSAIDILPMIGVVFYMFAAFQRDEQKTRLLTILNASVYFFYFLTIGSTSIFVEVVAIITNGLAMYKYRKKANRTAD